MKKLLLILLIFTLVSTSAYGTSKEDIIKLSQAGTREDVIITHLRAQAELKLSPEDIKELKEAGVGEKVINFLIDNQGDMTTFYNPAPRYRYFDGWKYGMYNYYDYMFFSPWPWYGPYWYGPYWYGPGNCPGHGH